MLAKYLTKKWQTTQWNNIKKSAGPRYTAEIDVELPIRDFFEGLGRTELFFSEIRELNIQLREQISKLKKRNNRYKYNVQNRIPKIHKHADDISSILVKIANDTSILLPFNEIPKKVNWAFQHIKAIQNIIYKQEEKEEKNYEILQKEKSQNNSEEEVTRISYRKDSEYLSSLKFLREDLRKLSGLLREIDALAKGLSSKLANDPFILLLGGAGMGKTHLLCDVAKNRLHNNYKTIIILGEEIPKISSPLKTIIKAKKISASEISFLNEVNNYGKKKRRRVLMIIDAINESDIEGWKTNLLSFKKRMQKYPWIGVVLSCRTPFENVILPKNFKTNIAHHYGFSDYEFQAMKAFFGHHKIPLPEVPVLISEFSSPLFLSSFCNTAVSLRGGRRKVAKKVKDISLGQKGMTTILEDFYISKQTDIYKRHGNLFPQIITQDWLWDKSSGEDCVIKSFAKSMATKNQEFLFLDETLDILKNLFGDKYEKKTFHKILDLLVEYRVVIKDLAYVSKEIGYKEVVKFPFQKFSDHLIARYLLENYLKVYQLRKSFSANSRLGELFKDEHTLYKRANLAEAIIVEFTERIKRNKKTHNKDITDYLSRSIINSHIFREIYIQALYWRRPDNFQNNNKELKSSIISYFNKTLLRYTNSSKDLLDFFITTAVKPRHPLNYQSLSNWLEGMSMKNRDVFWTEYLRNSYDSDPVYRLINWIEDHDITKISEEHATAVIRTLSWFLPTTSHLLRNRTTRCIYLVGNFHPKVCFEQTLATLSVNDPYIKERMLAASYGIVMRLSLQDKSSYIDDPIKNLAENIYKNFFRSKAQHSTTHVYIRDYARGIVELALHKKLFFLRESDIKKIRPPYMRGGIRKWGKSDDKDEGLYRDGNSPLGMDFANYTLGRLVRNRSNYDFKNKEYQKVKKNILWRIYQLGYSLEIFGDIDKQIVSSERMTRNDYPTKVDRYGKKYSWIAYYELMGYRGDKKLINPFWEADTYREGDNDIDPSFPLLSHRKYPINTNLLKGPRDMKKWLSDSEKPDLDKYAKIKIKESDDEWILIQGTLGQLNESTAKRNSIFIDGIFVSKKEKKNLLNFLNSVDYLGNNLISDLPEIRCEYLGELGWHPDYSKPEELQEIKSIIGYKKVKLSKKEREIESIRLMIFGDKEGSSYKTINLNEYRNKPIYKKFKIRKAARYCHSKDYKNLGREDGLGLYVPSNSVISNLKLHKDPNNYDFLDTSNNLATMTFVEGGQYKSHKNLLYIRKDLLKKLENKYKKTFLLCVWGERQYWPNNLDLIHREDYSEIYQARKNLHRQFITF